jgi:hypothetical protein
MKIFDVTSMPNKTRLAAVFLFTTFVFKFLGFALGWTKDYRTLGGVFLILAFISIAIAITLCILQMKQDKHEQIPTKDEVLKWMKHHNLD